MNAHDAIVASGPSAEQRGGGRRQRRFASNLDASVLVVITHAHVRLRGRLAFALASLRLLRALPGQDGLIGYAAGMPRFAAEAWTVTAWRDHAALENFHHSAAHRRAMHEGARGLVDIDVLHLRCHRDDVPTRWRSVRELLRAHRRRDATTTTLPSLSGR